MIQGTAQCNKLTENLSSSDIESESCHAFLRESPVIGFCIGRLPLELYFWIGRFLDDQEFQEYGSVVRYGQPI